MTTNLLSPELEIESLAGAGSPHEPAPRISIVIPLYNEEESIPHLW
jgi:cellulose synthase/poly-beta-1,6-N-acetylglucosamine synthase-like glycosyltransferase